MEELLFEEAADNFFKYYAYKKWSYSTIEYAENRFEKHILPYFADLKMSTITSEMLEEFYLQKLDSGCTERVVKEIHKIINGIFREAIKRKLVDSNPCDAIEFSKIAYTPRNIWDAKTFFKACDLCSDEMLLLAMHIAFGCTLRIAEILALQWNRIYLDDDNPYLFVDRIIERVKTEIIHQKHHKEILFEFPILVPNSTTTVVLKTPKTRSSIRKVFIPASITEMLRQRKRVVENNKKLNNSYFDYDLVFCFPDGKPMEKRIISDRFDKLIQKNNLPKVVFHSLRHTSITYKLKLTQGDIKSVQGDSGHASAKMVSDVYSHILDDERANNALLIEKHFYNSTKNEKINEKLDSERILQIIESLSKLL